ncbi:MAG: hypothetical protein H6548_09985 [Chitinophagales bacterium]|nr:hydroxyacid dehydrogenase [Chitinophagales bacterium]MCB9019036.1 hypothetical protein [Chitinophagales bacterium]MCB9022439.1 hypothetical protein [Chitinophagales bacterium]
MKILITDFVHPDLVSLLAERGHQVTSDPAISYKQLSEVIAPFEGLIVSTRLPIDKAIIDAAPNLRFIARVGSGMEHIDMLYAQEKGIRVVSSPEGNANAVAEHALGMLLALLRHIPRAVQEIRQQKWIREANRGIELKGRTIGIIGVGHTGTAFARKLSGMEMRVLGYDRYRNNTDLLYVTPASIQEISEQAEIISFHVPLTAETHYYLNRSFIDNMKNPFILINTSRGKVVSTVDLIDGLSSGKIRGAALDVLENEQFSLYTTKEKEVHEALMAFEDRVLITPHIAGWTKESKYLLSSVLLDKLSDLL